MRIALLSYEYPAETGFGGIGTYTWYQARALARRGHDVHVLAGSRRRAMLRQEHHDGVQVWRSRVGMSLRLFCKVLDQSGIGWTATRLENGYNMMRAFRALDARAPFDIVEMPECGAEGLWINRTTATPTIVRFHSPARLIMDFYDRHLRRYQARRRGPSDRLRRPLRQLDKKMCPALEQMALAPATAYTSCSSYLASRVAERMLDGAPVEVIPNGIDLELFDAAETLDVGERFGLPGDRPIILFAGRMEDRKGVHLLPEIAAAILERHAVDLVLAGDDLFGYVRQTILPRLAERELRGECHFLGQLGQIELRSCLRRADMVLIPSLWENFPYSCLEAMAARCAIVASDAGGLPEMIHHGESGWIAASDDASAFVRGLDRLIEEPSLRRGLAEAARRRVEREFSDGVVAERSLAFYTEVRERAS